MLPALLLLSLLGAHVEAQAGQAAAPDDELFRTIESLDRAVFDAYNQCDLEKFGSFFPEELEFYHDDGGLTARSRKSLVEGVKNNICGKVTRALVPDTLEVYPMRGYGALETGVHRFHHPGRESTEPVGEAKFVHLWQYQDGAWRITRVISYDHHALPLFGAPGGSAAELGTSRRGPLEDHFLQNLVGDWKISRRIRGTVVANTLTADWVLQHQFVQLRMKDVATPSEYEALVLIGYDAKSDRYVAHWCDSFGAQYAGVGYGKRAGNSIDFVFGYADGPFHNTFSWDPATNTWTFLMQAEDKDGTRRFFAEDTVRRK